MANINKSIKTGSGFLLKNAPLDVKLTAATIQERNSYVRAGQNVLYKGAIVYVEADDQFYVYTGTEPSGEDFSGCFRVLVAGPSKDQVVMLEGDQTINGTKTFSVTPKVNTETVATTEGVEATIAGKIGSELQAHSERLDKLAAFAEEGLVARATDGSIKAVTVKGTGGEVGVATDINAGTVTVSLENAGNAGTYTKVTTDAKGRVTAGENPTTLEGYGIVDAVNVKGGSVGKLTYTGVDVSNLGDNDLVPKVYADSVALGYTFHDACQAGTQTNVAGTYSDGSNPEQPGVDAKIVLEQSVTAIGGVNLKAGLRVLLMGQTAGKENGAYVVSGEQAPFTLTRVEDFDGHPKVNYNGASFLVTEGDFEGSAFRLANTGAIVFGTDEISFTQIASKTKYTAGAGITIDANTVAVAQGTTVSVIAGKLEVNSGKGNQGKVLVAGADDTAASYEVLNLSTLEGTLAVSKGGTGANTLPADQLVVGNGTEAVKAVANAEGVLVGSVDGAPAFGKADLTKHVSGILPVANGGFGTATHTEGAIVIGGAGNALAEVAPAVGVLKSTGTGAPAFGKVSVESDIEGTLAIANGGTGATDKEGAFAALAPVGATKGDIMYYDGAKWVALGKGPKNSLLAVTANGLEYVTEIDGGTF